MACSDWHCWHPTLLQWSGNHLQHPGPPCELLAVAVGSAFINVAQDNQLLQWQPSAFAECTQQSEAVYKCMHRRNTGCFWWLQLQTRGRLLPLLSRLARLIALHVCCSGCRTSLLRRLRPCSTLASKHCALAASTARCRVLTPVAAWQLGWLCCCIFRVQNL